MSESLHASLMPEARQPILRLDDISWGKFAFDVRESFHTKWSEVGVIFTNGEFSHFEWSIFRGAGHLLEAWVK